VGHRGLRYIFLRLLILLVSDRDGDLPRAKHIRLPDFPYRDSAPAYHVTICANRPARPFNDPRLAASIIDTLNWLRENRGVEIYGYCLMPDHLHLLLRLTKPNWTLSQVIHSFKSVTTRKAWALDYEGTIWQRRFYDHILRKSEDASEIVRYMLANPVRAGLVEDPDDYPYSGILDPL